MSSRDSPSWTWTSSSASSASRSASEVPPGPAAVPAEGTKILFNNGFNAPNVTIARIRTVDNWPIIFWNHDCSYHFVVITSISWIKSPLVTTIVSSLSSLKPTASLTREVIFSLSSSLIGSETTVPSGVSIILFLTKTAVLTFLIFPIWPTVVLSFLLTS